MAEALNRHFQAMARNNRWANHRLYKACMALEPGEFAQTRTSFFPSLAETLNHIHAVDLYYLDALTEGGKGRATYRERAEIADPAELASAQARTDWQLIDFCNQLRPSDEERRVRMDREENGVFHERIGEVLAHLFQHQIHHRGQAHAMLSGTTVAPPQLDEFFLEFEQATDIDEALTEGRR